MRIIGTGFCRGSLLQDRHGSFAIEEIYAGKELLDIDEECRIVHKVQAKDFPVSFLLSTTVGRLRLGALQEVVTLEGPVCVRDLIPGKDRLETSTEVADIIEVKPIFAVIRLYRFLIDRGSYTFVDHVMIPG